MPEKSKEQTKQNKRWERKMKVNSPQASVLLEMVSLCSLSTQWISSPLFFFFTLTVHCCLSAHSCFHTFLSNFSSLQSLHVTVWNYTVIMTARTFPFISVSIGWWWLMNPVHTIAFLILDTVALHQGKGFPQALVWEQIWEWGYMCLGHVMIVS